MLRPRMRRGFAQLRARSSCTSARAGLVDEVIVYVAPKLLGSDAQALLQLPGIHTLAEGIQLEFLDVAMVGKDCRMRLRVLQTV